MYDRIVDGRTLELGVSSFARDVLVLYDRQTATRWDQLSGEAVTGELAGRRLKVLPSKLTSWREWRREHPDTGVYVKPEVFYRSRFTAVSSEPGP